jgi:hypothetical protein
VIAVQPNKQTNKDCCAIQSFVAPLVAVGIYRYSVKDWIGVQNIFASVNIGAGVAQSVK